MVDMVTAYVVGWLAFLILIPTLQNLLGLDAPHAIVVAWVLSWLLFLVLVWY